jgi:hypothetical protein
MLDVDPSSIILNLHALNQSAPISINTSQTTPVGPVLF